MQQCLKKFIAAFFLLNFLFLQVTEIAHRHIHENDLHCSDNSSHFHKAEIHCVFCAIAPLITDAPPGQQFYITLPIFLSGYTPFYKVPNANN